jgi:hypothetical protein
MKRFPPFIVCFACIQVASLLSLWAAQSDQRLDGIWVGTEAASAGSSRLGTNEQKFVPPPRQIQIIIAQGGTMVGIISGICPGRYEHVQRAGDTLTFGAKDCVMKVTLSRDGKNLTEHGNCFRVTEWLDRAYYG